MLPAPSLRLTDELPGLSEVALSTFSQTLEARADEAERVTRLLGHMDRLIDVGAVRRAAVIGCGPKPEIIRVLQLRGIDAYGVEPVPLFVKAAREYLGDTSEVRQGAAEKMPAEDED